MVTNPRRIPAGVSIVDMANAMGIKKRYSPEELQARVGRSLAIANPLDNTDALAIATDSQMTLHITEIDPYDRNPRRTKNERLGDIKASIRQIRTLSPLTVTKRPGAPRYMVEAGGNSRLQVIKELWEETHDPRFEYLVVTARPWVSESHVLTAHLVENETRGDMVFWDKARAMADLKTLIEVEQGTKLSLRNLEIEAKARGLVVSRAVLSWYAFAVENLTELGDATVALGSFAVKALQPAFNHLHRYAGQYGCNDERWQALRDEVLRREARTWQETGNLDADAIIDRLDQAVALAVLHSVEQVRAVRELAHRFGSENISSLVLMVERDRAQAPSRQTSRTANDGPAAPECSAPQAADAGPECADPAATPARSAPDARERERGTPTERIQERLTDLARLCSVGDCLRLTDDMPAGFYMEIPDNDTPIDLDSQSPDRYSAWWALAALSGQISGVHATRMPIDSAWRRAQLGEDASPDNRLGFLIETVLGNPLDVAELTQWLTSPANPGAESYCQLVAKVRELRQSTPERFAIAHSHGSPS